MKASIEIDGKAFPFELEGREGKTLLFSMNGKSYRAEVLAAESEEIRLRLNENPYTVKLKAEGGQRFAATPGPKAYRVQADFLDEASAWLRRAAAKAPRKEIRTAGQPGAVDAPMPGRVIAVDVAVGDEIKAGDLLLTLEAMKMENRIQAPADGVVAEVNVSVGTDVQKGDSLVVVRPADAS